MTPQQKSTPSRMARRNVVVERTSLSEKPSNNLKPVSFPLDRRDRRRLSGLIQLFPQPADMDVDQIGAGIEIISPHLLEDEAAAYRLAGIADQEFQQAEFHAGK